MQAERLQQIGYGGSFHAAPPFEAPAGSLAPGSRNQLVLKGKKKRPYKGLTSVGKASRRMFQVRDAHGGLSDYVTGTTGTGAMTAGQNRLTATAGVFVLADVGKYALVPNAGGGGLPLVAQITAYVSATQVDLAYNAVATVAAVSFAFGTLVQGEGTLDAYVGNSLWYIGAGQVTRNGSDVTGALASTTLKLLLSRSGSYTAADSGPYSAGIAQPSAPDVAVLTTPGTGYTGKMDGAYSFKIARLRTTTGARSVASVTSAVVVPRGQTVRLTLPAAVTGQTHWVVFATEEGFGGTGLHYRLALSGGTALQISEADVAASTVDGVARSIELDFQSGDLNGETAWTDDYPPPAGTHACAMENFRLVGGAYADATDDPTTTNAGTCIIPSLRNAPESYKPTHLLYLPEAVVSVLSRPTDSHSWWGCRNSIHAVVATGAIDGPPCAVITPLPNTGIANPGNWCQHGSTLVVYSAKGQFTVLDDEIPADFADPVYDLIKDWEQDSTVVRSHPDTDSVTVSNGSKTLSYCVSSGDWSTPVYQSDFASGSVIEGVPSEGKLYLNLSHQGVQRLYEYDAGSGSSITCLSDWQRPPGGAVRAKVVKMFESVECDNVARAAVVSLHRNMRRTYADDAAMASGDNLLTATAGFTADDVGSWVLVMGAGASGGPLLARIKSCLSATQVRLCAADHSQPVSALSALNASTTCAGKYVLVAARMYQRALPRSGRLQFAEKRVTVRELFSYAVGVTLFEQAAEASVLYAEPWGTAQAGGKGLTR